MGRALAAAVRQNSGKSTSQMQCREDGTDVERGRRAAASLKAQGEHEERQVTETTRRLSAAIEMRGLTFELTLTAEAGAVRPGNDDGTHWRWLALQRLP